MTKTMQESSVIQVARTSLSSSITTSRSITNKPQATHSEEDDKVYQPLRDSTPTCTHLTGIKWFISALLLSCISAYAQDYLRFYPAKDTLNGGFLGRVFVIDTTNRSMVLHVHRSTTSTRQEIAASILSASTTYHIAVTWEGAGTDANIYPNGIEPSYAVTTTGAGTVTDYSANNFTIGGRIADNTSFGGRMWDARIYNRSLTATEIALRAAGRRKYDSFVNGLIHSWPLDDQLDRTAGDGDTYVDRAGTSNATGSDGANNSGLTKTAEAVLS